MRERGKRPMCSRRRTLAPGSIDTAEAAGYAVGVLAAYAGFLTGIAYFRDPLRKARRRALIDAIGASLPPGPRRSRDVFHPLRKTRLTNRSRNRERGAPGLT